jgi:hypothetical protein
MLMQQSTNITCFMIDPLVKLKCACGFESAAQELYEMGDIFCGDMKD